MSLCRPECHPPQPFPAQPYSGPGCPPRPTDCRCICTSSGLSKGFHNSITPMTILCHTYLPSARIELLMIIFDAGIAEVLTEWPPESADRHNAPITGPQTPTAVFVPMGEILMCLVRVPGGRLVGPSARAPGQANGGNVPGSGRFVACYISRCLTSTIDPKRKFSIW